MLTLNNEKSRSLHRITKDAPALTLASLPNLRSLWRELQHPMLLKPVSKLPTGAEWMYEIKLDGNRILGSKSGKIVAVQSRHEKSFGETFPELLPLLAALPCQSAVIDGEVINLDKKGRSSLIALQNRAHRSGEAILRFYAFDLLYLDGKDLRDLPFVERKAQLKKLLTGSDIHYLEAFPGPSKKLLDFVLRHGLEGIVAKRAESPYSSNTRSSNWVKFKPIKVTQLTVGGYNISHGRIESLLLGTFIGKQFHFEAKVKNGFNPINRKQLLRLLTPLEQSTAPFHNFQAKASTHALQHRTHWVKPHIAVQILSRDRNEKGIIQTPVFRRV